MFGRLNDLINIERWNYAVDCVSQLYGMEITPNSMDDSSRSESVYNPPRPQQSKDYGKIDDHKFVYLFFPEE